MKMKRKIFLKPTHYFFFCLLLSSAAYSILPFFNWIGFPWNFFGIIPIAIGAYFVFSSYALLKKHKTAVNFEKSSFLVTEGVYEYSSNPMYFGAFLFLLGISLILGNIASFISPAVFFAVINYMFIPYEEEKGEMEFGEEYKKYKKKSKKWI